jgi:hypothetical protein
VKQPVKVVAKKPEIEEEEDEDEEEDEPVKPPVK